MAKEKEIYIDLSKKIKLSDTLYISIGSLILSAVVALLQFIITLNGNNWVLTPSCWAVFLNFIYAVRSGIEFGEKDINKMIKENTSIENTALITKIENRIEKVIEKKLSKVKKQI